MFILRVVNQRVGKHTQKQNCKILLPLFRIQAYPWINPRQTLQLSFPLSCRVLLDSKMDCRRWQEYVQKCQAQRLKTSSNTVVKVSATRTAACLKNVQTCTHTCMSAKTAFPLPSPSRSRCGSRVNAQVTQPASGLGSRHDESRNPAILASRYWKCQPLTPQRGSRTCTCTLHMRVQRSHSLFSAPLGPAAGHGSTLRSCNRLSYWVTSTMDESRNLDIQWDSLLIATNSNSLNYSQIQKSYWKVNIVAEVWFEGSSESIQISTYFISPIVYRFQICMWTHSDVVCQTEIGLEGFKI